MKKDFELIKLGQSISIDCFDRIVFKKMIKIKRMAKMLHKFCESYCNEENFEYEKIDNLRKKIKIEFGELPIGLNLKILEFQNDPRGWEIKTNNYFFDIFLYVK